jgi:hypothetical protein
MGKYDEATTAFKQSITMVPANPAIKDSPVLKKDLGCRDVEQTVAIPQHHR